MLKKYSYLDYIFILIAIGFAGVSAYEFIRFIIPHYTYVRALGVFFVFIAGYVGYNTYKVFKDNDRALKLPESVIASAALTKGNTLMHLGRKYINTIVYSTFIALVLLMIVGQVYHIPFTLLYALIGFVIVYIYGRALGFKPAVVIIKSKLQSLNTLRFFIILYAVYFVSLKYIADSFGVPQEGRGLLYGVWSMIYFISGYIMFFDSTPVTKWLKAFLFGTILRPYPIAMTILIVGLTGYIVAKNNLIEQIGESRVPEIIQEGITWVEEDGETPGIISGEASLQNQSREIEYETVLVSSEYNIVAGLQLGSEGASVELLQTVLGNLQYFIGDVNGIFAEDTQSALTDALKSECDWPETTRGIFGPQAKDCIDNLEISIEKQDQETNLQEAIISNEAL